MDIHVKKKIKQLEKENQALRVRLEEAEESLRAIKAGEVDALVVSGPEGEQVFTLKEANRPYRVILEEMEEGAVTLTESGLILYSNKQFAAMIGIPLSKLIGSSIYTYLLNSQSKILEEHLSRRHKKIRKGEILFGRHERNRMHALVSFRPLEIEGESLFIGVITDITQLKLAEEDRIRLAAAIEQAFNSVVISDLKGNILYANPACERLTGYDFREIKGQSLNIFGSHNGRKLINFIRIALENEDVWRGHVSGRKKDDTPYELELTASSIRSSEGKVTHYIVIGQDITRETELQEQILHLQRLEAIGRLAGGIAHDLNNILYPIIINCEMLLDDAVPGSELFKKLDEIHKAANRQKDLIKQILIFSRHSEQKFISVKVIPLIREAVKFSRSSLPSTIEIREYLNAKTDTIHGDPTQIHQIIMNLCSNAADAISPSAGKIDVHLDNIKLEETEHPVLKPGNYLRMRVSDNGRGMETQVLNKIFDPFFTTKEHGQGTGMGLAVVHGIIKNHKGSITAKSVPGEGSRFEIFLPIIKKSPKIEKTFSDDRMPPIKKRILLVDDEELVVRAVKNALSRNGFEVTTATDSLEALGILRRGAQKFDLMITDQTMPRMTGLQLAHEIIRFRPDMPIILWTGYSDMVGEQDVQKMGIRKVLMKPVDMKELTVTIECILSQPQKK